MYKVFIQKGLIIHLQLFISQVLVFDIVESGVMQFSLELFTSIHFFSGCHLDVFISQLPCFCVNPQMFLCSSQCITPADVTLPIL